ncbi:MAG: ComE operon protein 3 [Syntrophomonadaceae bacterium]|nr:ComE operon protein 3 [Bacillota bacterium]
MTDSPLLPRQSGIIPLCASFIAGVTLSTILSGWILFPPSFSVALRVVAILFIIIGVRAILTEKPYPQALIFFCLFLLFLGMARHAQATDTSSPYHITNFLNDREEVLILGTVVRDPDRMEEFSILTIKPEKIVPHPQPDAYLKLDLKVPHKVITQKIIGVFDGDTLFTYEGKVVRLLGVDAPDLGEKGAKEATSFTSSMVLHRKVTLYVEENRPLDKFGRILAVVELDGRLLNSQLIERGLARYYPCPHMEILRYECYQDKKKILRGRTGYIQARVYPTIGEYYEKMSFGDRVEVISFLHPPRGRRNPAGFDFARYLRVRNVYAVTSRIREPEQLCFLGEGDVNSLIKLSLRLRHRIFETIERTVPYPESAFLAAVTLGMRGGLSGEIRERFRAVGIAHVLALSGLHTGFIALLLMGAARLLHLPRSMRFLLVSFGLLIFVFLSGASPATQRAALMFSLGMLLYDILRVPLVTSVGITIFLSAVVVLFTNPLWLTDASFVLSFAAVLSLAYITPPIEKVVMMKGTGVRGFIGFPLIGILVGMNLFSLSGIVQHLSVVREILPAVEKIPPLLDWFPAWIHFPGHSWLHQSQFLTATLLLGATSITTFFICLRWTGRDLMIELFSRKRGRYLLRFCFAQLAIQLGMLWPLSAVFFLRFPIAGLYANILAIPLLGAIVMLGWVAGLGEILFSVIGLGFIGNGFAMAINGFNTVLCQGFLGLARTWHDFIPFPYVGAYGTGKLIFWYGLIFSFIFHKEIFQKILEVKRKFWQRRKLLAMLVVISLFITVGAAAYLMARKPLLKIVFFDAGFGNAMLVSTPEGKSILIDGGPRKEEWSFGETIRETLSHYRISQLDYIIITSLRPGNIGGLAYVVEHIPVKRVVLPVKEEMLRAELSYEEFLILLDDWRLLSNPFMPHPQKIYTEYMALIELLEDAPLQIKTIRKSRLLYAEDGLKIEALVPSTVRGLDSFSLVLRISYGEKVIILPAQVGVAAQKRLTGKYPDKLLGDVMLIPVHGNPEKQVEEFITAISPAFAINQYGWSPCAEFFPVNAKEATLARYAKMGIVTYSTAKSGAVTLTTDGRELTLK